MGGLYGRTEEKRRIYGVLSERIEKQRQREREREIKWKTEYTKLKY